MAKKVAYVQLYTQISTRRLLRIYDFCNDKPILLKSEPFFRIIFFLLLLNYALNSYRTSNIHPLFHFKELCLLTKPIYKREI